MLYVMGVSHPAMSRSGLTRYSTSSLPPIAVTGMTCGAQEPPAFQNPEELPMPDHTTPEGQAEPVLPEPDIVSSQIDSTMRRLEVRSFSAAAMRAYRAEGERELREECDELHTLNRSLSDLLNGVANAIRGMPPPRTLWSFHDLPDRAQAAVNSLGGAVQALSEVTGERDEWRAKLEAAERTNLEWLHENGPGGWIDQLRADLQAANARLKYSSDMDDMVTAELAGVRAELEAANKGVDDLMAVNKRLLAELETLKVPVQTKLLADRAAALEECISHAFDNLPAVGSGVAKLKIHARAAAQQLASAAAIPTSLPKITIVASAHCIEDPVGAPIPVTCRCHNEDGSVTLYVHPLPAAAPCAELTALKAAVATMLAARDNYGWSSDTDKAIDKLRGTPAATPVLMAQPMDTAPKDGTVVQLLVPTRFGKWSKQLWLPGHWLGDFWVIFNPDEAIMRVEPIRWHGIQPEGEAT